MKIWPNWWTRQKIKLAVQLFPRLVLCFVTGGHRWGESSPTMVDGPIMLDDGTLVPPRERNWSMIALGRQCRLCYHVDMDIPFTEEEAAAYIEEAIREDEEEFNEM